MKKNMDLSEDEIKAHLQEFYNYFSDGYKFEEFLKCYLERLGLDEVVVTKRSRDGGIDLTAVRTGIGAFGSAGAENYFIQAKRNNTNSTVSPEKVRALRGSISTYGKGLFITTARISDATKIDAAEFDLQKPIIIIDGRDLVLSCIENEVGFTYKPTFSTSAMDAIMKKEISFTDSAELPLIASQFDDNIEFVEKQITANDIRARILSIPKFVFERISETSTDIRVSFNNGDPIMLTINRGRNYLGGVTDAFKKFGLLTADGSFNPAKAKWHIDKKEQLIRIYIAGGSYETN